MEEVVGRICRGIIYSVRLGGNTTNSSMCWAQVMGLVGELDPMVWIDAKGDEVFDCNYSFGSAKSDSLIPAEYQGVMLVATRENVLLNLLLSEGNRE